MNELEPVTERVSVAGHGLGTLPLDAFITATYEAYSAAVYGLALHTTRDPGVAPEACMLLDGLQLSPLLETLLRYGDRGGIDPNGSFHARARSWGRRQRLKTR